MVILVTGGAGFIGSHLCRRLLREGHRVVCLDNFDDFYNPEIKRGNIQEVIGEEQFGLIEGDIRDTHLIARIFGGQTFDVVVHLAARAGVRPSIDYPKLYEEVNVQGTINLLESCREFGIPSFVFASSSSVYGGNSKVPFSEEDRVETPISPYGATKRAGELFCYSYHHLFNINITCLRYFTVYGPRQRPEMAIHRFTRLIDESEMVPMYGDGQSMRDYTYIDDIIDGTLGAISRNKGYEIYNLGESRTVKLIDLIRMLEETLGKKAIIEGLPEQRGDMPITYANIEKARKKLGYAPRVSMKEGIGRFVDWYRQNRSP
ncbi:MAG: NAD-dependent epimerase/dehydratase family protein [Proteobacteria bacterium]|nr:NAD-dependent epimerase/dehydratase family protein [Pseudomonadota bacterium]